MAETFWAQKDSQPKRQHRFLMTLGSTDIPQWVVSQVSRPSMEISTVEHQYMNHTFKFPGRAKWNNVSVTLRDPLQPDASDLIMKVLEKAGYRAPNKSPDDAASKQTFTKAKFSEAIGTIKIHALDAEGKVNRETWTLHNPMVVSVNWGEFNYGSEELVDITMDIAYDYATITTQTK